MRRAAAMVAAAVAMCVASLVTAAPASAHAVAGEVTPAREAVVSSPAAVIIRFDQQVRLTGSGLQVRTERGRLVASELALAPSDTIAVRLPAKLASGIYAVGFVVISGDTDVVSDSYRFRVRGEAGAAGSAKDGRSLRGAAVGLGLVALVGLCWLVGRHSKRLAATVTVLVLSGAAVLAVVTRGGDQAGNPFVVRLSPARAGLTTVQLQLPSRLQHSDEPDLRLVLDSAKLSVHVPLGADGPGRWVQHDVDLPLAGRWRVEVSVLTERTQELADTFVDVAASH